MISITKLAGLWGYSIVYNGKDGKQHSHSQTGFHTRFAASVAAIMAQANVTEQ